jgi:hypothetical protein
MKNGRSDNKKTIEWISKISLLNTRGEYQWTAVLSFLIDTGGKQPPKYNCRAPKGNMG